MAHALDPVRLFQQVEQLQQAVFRCAASCSPFVSNIPSAPLRVFFVEDSTAGTLPSVESVPDPAVVFHTLYREQERRKRILGWRRTYKDPFEGEWEQITSWFIANPERSSGDIFRELQRLSPGWYQPFEEQWQEGVIQGRSIARASLASRRDSRDFLRCRTIVSES